MPELGVSKRSRVIIVGCGEDRSLCLEALRKIKDRCRRCRVLRYGVSDGDVTMLSALDPTAT